MRFLLPLVAIPLAGFALIAWLSQAPPPSPSVVPAAGPPSERALRREIPQARAPSKPQTQATANLASELDGISLLPTKEDRDVAWIALCRRVAVDDPARALAIAWEFSGDRSESPEADAALDDLARTWGETDLPAALEWARARPGGEHSARRERILKALAVVWAQTDPAAAAAMVTRDMPAGEMQTTASLAVLETWARRDPAGASTWAEQFPADGLRQAAVQRLARGMSADPPR